MFFFLQTGQSSVVIMDFCCLFICAVRHFLVLIFQQLKSKSTRSKDHAKKGGEGSARNISCLRILLGLWFRENKHNICRTPRLFSHSFWCKIAAGWKRGRQTVIICFVPHRSREAMVRGIKKFGFLRWGWENEWICAWHSLILIIRVHLFGFYVYSNVPTDVHGQSIQNFQMLTQLPKVHFPFANRLSG